MYILGVIQLTKTERGLAFESPGGGLRDAVQVVLPGEPDEVLQTTPDGEPAIAVCLPESFDLGVYVVPCGCRAPILKEKIGLLQKAMGSVAFKDLGLELVALDEGPDIRLNRPLGSLLFSKPAAALSQSACREPCKSDRVVTSLEPDGTDEVFELEILPVPEDMEQFKAIRLFCCQEGRRVTLWTRSGDRRLMAEALVLQPGTRFKARVVNRVEDNLEIDSIEVLEEEAA